MHERITIQNLIKLGRKKIAIANDFGCHRNTVCNIAKENPVKETKERVLPEHSLDLHTDYIKKKMDDGLTLVRIHQDLMTYKDFRGSYDALRRFVKSRNLKPQKAYIVLHADPGEEAQVDFGYVGLIPDEDGAMRKSWVFSMILSYSRKGFFAVVRDQKVDTFIGCHRDAFEYFDGIPTTVKIDNLKSAILEANFYEPVHQRIYKEFAGYYSFVAIPCKVRSPEEKGKVESGIKYVKGNFFKGRSFASFDDCNAQLSDWMEHTCNARIHGTTKKIPAQVFEEEERQKLMPLPEKPWQTYTMERRKVSTICHIGIHGSYYSVPYKYIGDMVDVKIGENIIHILAGGGVIAVHTRLREKGVYQTNSNHYPPHKAQSHEEHSQKQEERMKCIGDDAHQYFLKLKEEHPKDWNRKVAGILNLARKHGAEAVNKSCQRAMFFDVYSYRSIFNICEKKLYINTKFPEAIHTKNMQQQTNFKCQHRKASLTRPLSYYSHLFLSSLLISWISLLLSNL